MTVRQPAPPNTANHYFCFADKSVRERTGELVILDLMSDYARRHSEAGGEVLDVFVSDNMSWQSLSKEIRRNKKLGCESTITLLPFGPGACHDQWLPRRNCQIFEQGPAESKTNGFFPAFGYGKPRALARVRCSESIQRAG